MSRPGKRKLIAWFLCLTALAGAFLLGMAFVRYGAYAEIRQWLSQQSKAMGKKPVAQADLKDRRVLRILVIGQSNAGNWGESRVAADSCILNFHAGALYRAEDPLLGADGGGGSPWSRFDAESCRRLGADFIVVALVSRGGTGIDSFAAGGDQNQAILDTIRSMNGAGLPPDFVLYFQGEADAAGRTPGEAYRRKLEGIVASLREHGVKAPVLVSQTSWLPRERANEEIRKAQSAAVSASRGIFSGPDTDQFGYAARFDGLHFSDEGLRAVSRAWVKAMLDTRSAP